MSSPKTHRLLRALEGDLSQAEQDALEADLAQSPPLRAEFTQLQQLASDLAAPDSRLQGLVVLAGIHAELDRSPVPLRSPHRLATASWVAAGALAAAAVTLMVTKPSLTKGDEGFAAKGTAAEDASRWAGIEAFRVEGVRVAGRVEKTLRQGDGLAFAYRNTGEHPFRHLMIFATDSKNRVFWFYPAWSESTSEPRAIDIGASSAPVELREVIRHDFEPGPLTIHGLFTNETVSVKDVEASLKQAGWLPGAVEQRLTVTVEPAP